MVSGLVRHIFSQWNLEPSNCAIAFWIIGVMNQGVAPMVGTPAPGGSPYGQQVSLLVWFSLDSRFLAIVFSEHMQTIFLPYSHAVSGRSFGAYRAAGTASISWSSSSWSPCHTAANNTHVCGSPTKDPKTSPLRGLLEIYWRTQCWIQQH